MGTNEDDLLEAYLDEFEERRTDVILCLSDRPISKAEVMRRTGLDWDDVTEDLEWMADCGMCHEGSWKLTRFGRRLREALG